MKDNIITYSDLKCPSVQLKCVLEDLFCGLIKNPTCLNFEMALSPSPINNLVITVGDTTHSVNLSSYLDSTQIQAFTLNDLSGVLAITESNGSTWIVNLTNAVKNLETNTSIINVIAGHKIADYSNEDGTLFPINETITTLSDVNFNTSTKLLSVTYINEAGTNIIKTASLSSLSPVPESITTVDSIEVSGPNIVLKFTNETGVQSQVSMPVTDICATCSVCFEVGNTLEYTSATKPATGSAGQIIYVSDVTATDGSTGTPMIWQVNTNSWKRVSIS